MPKPLISSLLAALLPVLAHGTAFSQAGPLDPGRDLTSLPAPRPAILPEQFIWTRGDAAALDPALQTRVRGQDDKTAPHYFRRSFSLAHIPREATLYLAGPRAATVYLNGKLVMHIGDTPSLGKGLHVYTADVHADLLRGRNTLAIMAVRGHSSLHTAASAQINQVTYGEVLVAKIVPRSQGVVATPLVISDGGWRSTLAPQGTWFAPDFDDSAWPTVQTLGAIGSKSGFLQWNADAGLYDWPGYAGISSFLRTFTMPVAGVEALSARPRFRNTESLLNHASHNHLIVMPQTSGGTKEAPALLLDFGKELNGRLHLVSASDVPVTVSASYGESRKEAMQHPYLGVRKIFVPAHGTAYGPKSGFRYIYLSFPNASTGISFSTIDTEAIAYPVHYRGSFTSSDPLLNTIWATGAYTAHLCMQDSIWDGVKRDRGRWMGDLDVTGRVINDVFADHMLMEATMRDLIGPSPVQRDVNTIPGYSALWITGEADFYRHSGDRLYLQSLHPQLLQLLGIMDQELDSDGLFVNAQRRKLFVDWSADFHSDTPEARAATHFEFYRAYQDAAYLLDQLGDTSNAERYRHQAAKLRRAADGHLFNPATGTYGSRWQTNAMAVVSNAASAADYDAIWRNVLSRIDEQTPDAPVITPYYGYYVLSAMARTGHRREALDWMRHYWGGMIAEGATSFWESYDPRWPKRDFHAHLQADNKTGYYVSLAHGWSSGPTAWLMEEILGIHATAAGFREVTIRPDLAGLKWARGSEPTPRGLITVDVRQGSTIITIPTGTVARVLVPINGSGRAVLSNGRIVASRLKEDGTRAEVLLEHAGRYELRQ